MAAALYMKSIRTVPVLLTVTPPIRKYSFQLVFDLSEAVALMAKTQLNNDLSEQQVKDIVAFLGALTGEYPEIMMPRLPATSGYSLVAD